MIVVIVGPTASGKSDLAVALAKRFCGEVVSADSRQVYRGLNLGSGKITEREMRGVPHHLLSVASPKRIYGVSLFQKEARKAVQGILGRGRLAYIVGGSPQYVYALVDGHVFPDVSPNHSLRKRLEALDPKELYRMLVKKDPARAMALGQGNPRRIIRALEIIEATKKPIAALAHNPLPSPTLFLGLSRAKEDLQKRVRARLQKRLCQGMVAEVQRLRNSGVSWKRLESLGLEYRYIALYLQKRIRKEEMARQIQKESEDFARRQMAWFKKDPRIRWVSNRREAFRLVREFRQAPGQECF